MMPFKILVLTFLLSEHNSAQADILFLAHFDKKISADFAVGGNKNPVTATGVRAELPGCFGHQDDSAADIGYRTPTSSNMAFSARGTIDSRQGSIEFFLKTSWDWSTDGVGKMGNPEFLFVPLERGGYMMVYAYHHRPSGMVSLAFNLHDGKTDHSINANVSKFGKRAVAEPWKKDEWHHIVASWSPDETRLFADGKIVANKKWQPSLALPPVANVMWVGGRRSAARRVLIDELCIRDDPLKSVSVPKKPYPAPELLKPVKEGEPWATLNVYRTDARPSIDGRIDDDVWKKAPWVSGFQKVGSATEYAKIPTRFAVCYDDAALYLAVVCSEPNLATLRSDQIGQDGPVYGDDSIEIFIAPLRKAKPYYQLVFNTADGRYDGKGFDKSWNGNWTAKVLKGNGSWAAELRLPFVAIGLEPKAGQVWGFNVARNRYAGGGAELSTWSYLSAFHSVGRFGAIRFLPAKEQPATGRALAVNANYRRGTKKLTQRNHALWKRQLEWASRQLNARDAPEKLKLRVGELSRQVALLGKHFKELADYDEARIAGEALRVEVDSLLADVQRIAPIGPAQPPKGLRRGLSLNNDIWYFISSRATFAIDQRTGILAGLWDSKTDRRCVVASADHYWMETRTSLVEADALDDRVIQASASEQHLILSVTNPDLPGLSIMKEYWLKQDGILAKRFSVHARLAQPALLRVSSRTYFDEAFLAKAYYQRLLHPSINVDSIRKAKSVNAPVAQPGFMGGTPDGCAQFCASDLASGIGVGEYLLNINGKYAYPPRSLNKSYWTPWGWEMSWMACFLRPEPFRSEVHYMLYEGDHFAFHSRYQELPERKQAQAGYAVSPMAARSRFVTMPYVGWNQFMEGKPHPDVLGWAKIPTQLLRPDELTFDLQVQPGDNWGEFPTADGQRVRFVEPNTNRYKREYAAEAVKRGIRGLKDLGLTQLKPGFYQFLIDVRPDTPAWDAGWFIIDKKGNKHPGWFSAAHGSFLGDMSPEFIDHCVRGIAGTLDYYQTDFIYIDWPYLPCFADWKGQGRVIQTTDSMQLYRRIHEVCASRGAALFMNVGSGVLYPDVSIFEGMMSAGGAESRGFLEGKWRDLYADPLLMMKLYERPGQASHVWGWLNIWSDPKRDSTREVTNYGLLFGLRIPAASHSEIGDQLKAFTAPGGQPQWLANARSLDMYPRACMELADSKIVDIGLRPCWWREETEIEAYALRKGSAHVLTSLSHYNEPRNVTLAAPRKKLGLATGKRTFVWRFDVRSSETIIRQPDPPPPGWDRLCPTITCRSFLQDDAETVSVTMGEMPPLLVRLAAVTQTPGAIVSVHGQETQFVLPENLGCRIEGDVDEKTSSVRLNILNPKPCEAIAWWPKKWGKPKIQLNGKSVEGKAVAYGAEDFVRIALKKGDWDVKLSR